MGLSGQFKHETGVIHKVAANDDVRIYYEDHVLERMRERKIDRLDIEVVLKRGVVVESRIDEYDDERWAVQGSSLDGRRLIRVVVVVNEKFHMIDVVTAINLKK